MRRWAQATLAGKLNRRICEQASSAIAVTANRLALTASCGDVLPEIERHMLADFPDRLREWRASFEFGKAAAERWRNEVRDAEKKGAAAPPPMATAGPEPQSPRLRQTM